jgi:hypothetical protein
MIYWIDPLTDSRWPALVARHPSSSVFHSREWLVALKQAYGFAPTAITTCPPGSDLADAILFCRVNSILTGRRLVSLPFSDHCQPLAAGEQLIELLRASIEILGNDKLKYVELRPLEPAPLPGFAEAQRYIFHMLDLRPSLEELFRRFHESCIRRKIRRAGKEGLTTEAGNSGKITDEFYRLQVETRQKHGLPPQPRRWFESLMASMKENATIRVVRFQGRAVAAILMLRHKQIEIYKYGCSAANDSNLGGTQLLFWEAIQDAKARGMQSLDLGRSDIEETGLQTFKQRWGATAQTITYFRYPEQKQKQRNLNLAAGIFSRLPKPLLAATGRLFYRHIA